MIGSDWDARLESDRPDFPGWVELVLLAVLFLAILFGVGLVLFPS